MTMTDEQLLRYSRHILLDEIGEEGQHRLNRARALIVGAGGLGSPAALYLASSGLGRLSIADHDVVDLSNLQRQIGHDQAALGHNKAHSLVQRLRAINPDIGLQALPLRLEAAGLAAQVAEADVVLDCSDNFATRQAINAACVELRKPLVAGAALGFDAQISVYDPRDPDSPCYACVFPPQHVPQELRCAVMGVFAPLVGIVGSMQAAEALKLVLGLGPSLAGRLQMLDARAMQWSEMRVGRQPDCPVCGASHPRPA
jgi:molybdopterin/thiamine biosynthesis adenylyltransferase